MSNVTLFHKAGLPVNLDAFKAAINVTKDNVKVASGGTFLKLDKRDGVWRYGADDTEVQEGSLWAINPTSLKTGFIAWAAKGGIVLGKELRSILLPPVLETDLKDVGAEWTPCISMQLTCTNGDDEGTVVDYEQNSYGARKAFSELLTAFQAQLASGDPSKIVPLVSMDSDSYEHKAYGTVYNPLFTIFQWNTMDNVDVPAIDEDKVEDEPSDAEIEAEEQAEADKVEDEPAQPTRQRRAAGGGAPVKAAGRAAAAPAGRSPAKAAGRAPVGGKAPAKAAAKPAGKAAVVARRRRAAR